MVFELAVLGALLTSDLTVYDLRKSVSDVLGRAISDGTLYPAVSRLEKLGAIVPTATNPLRKAKRLYKLTTVGKSHFLKLLSSTDRADDSSTFLLQLRYAGWLNPSARANLFEERRRRVYLEHLEAEAKYRSRGIVSPYLQQMLKHELDKTELELRLVKDLIDQEELLRLQQKQESYATAAIPAFPK